MVKTYTLSSWRGWDRFVDTCAKAFAAEFGVLPNLLAASPATLRRMNLAANKKNVGNLKGDTPLATDYVELKKFAGKDYQLWLVTENELTDNSFDLIFAE